MSLQSESDDVCFQFTRYGGEVASRQLLDVLWTLTDVNDDIANGRDTSLIDENIDKAIAQLQAMKNGNHG